MQDNNIDVFISDAEIEYFELSKPISDQTWDEFVRERKAISLEFSRTLNPNLILSEPTIMSLIDSITKELSHHTGKEIRQPTKQQLNCLFANLYRQQCIHPEMWTRVSRRNQKPIPTRFNPSGINWKTIARLTDALEEIGYVVAVKGTFARNRGSGLTKSSRIRATPQLITLIEKQFGMKPSAIWFHPLAEPIVMRGKRDTNKQKPIIPYIDTPRSKADRKLLTAYNGFIQKQEIVLPQSMNE